MSDDKRKKNTRNEQKTSTIYKRIYRRSNTVNKKEQKKNTTKNQPKKVTMRIHNECVLQTHVTNKNT